MSLLITPADSAFSKCVRERAEWFCERCGTHYEHKPQGLHCSHYMGRGNWSTRFHPSNGVALCYGCHQYVGSRPNEHSDLVWKLRGITTVDSLRALSSSPARGLRKQVAAIAKHYRGELKRLQQYRAAGIVGWLDFEIAPQCPDFELATFRQAMGDDVCAT
jgi:hypothetical protein